MKKLIVFPLLLVSLNAFGFSKYLTTFKTTYPNSKSASTSCLLCHSNENDYATNAYGQDYANNNHNFKSIEGFDSDVDGHTNLAEINAGTQPGDRDSIPAPVVLPPAPVVLPPAPVVLPPTPVIEIKRHKKDNRHDLRKERKEKKEKERKEKKEKKKLKLRNEKNSEDNDEDND
jgi:hypothetical protein